MGLVLVPTDAKPPRSSDEARAILVERLRMRVDAMAQTIQAHLHEAVPHLVPGVDAAYKEGLNEAITAVLAYSFDAITRESDTPGPVPRAAVAQARRAACAGVSLGTV